MRHRRVKDVHNKNGLFSEWWTTRHVFWSVGFLFPFLLTVVRWSGVDPGGLFQRARAAAAGLGDVCLPHGVLHLFFIPHSPHHRPRGPRQHRLELLGKLKEEPAVPAL